MPKLNVSKSPLNGWIMAIEETDRLEWYELAAFAASTGGCAIEPTLNWERS